MFRSFRNSTMISQHLLTLKALILLTSCFLWAQNSFSKDDELTDLPDNPHFVFESKTKKIVFGIVGADFSEVTVFQANKGEKKGVKLKVIEAKNHLRSPLSFQFVAELASEIPELGVSFKLYYQLTTKVPSGSIKDLPSRFGEIKLELLVGESSDGPFLGTEADDAEEKKPFIFYLTEYNPKDAGIDKKLNLPAYKKPVSSEDDSLKDN